jgi:hypothetical protein
MAKFESTSVVLATEQNENLTEVEVGRIDQIVDRLFTLPMNSPQFVKFTDQFHTRMPRSDTSMDIGKSNVDIVLEMLGDFHSYLDILFPTEVGPKWDFRTQFEAGAKGINALVEKIRGARKVLRGDIDTNKTRLYDALAALRRSCLVATTLRERVEARTEKLSTEAQRAEMQEQAIFYLVQREMDLMTELAVTTQSYLALASLRKSTVMMVTNIERVLTTTVQALSNAVFVSSNIKASSINYMFETGRLLRGTASGLGFEGKKIEEMTSSFTQLKQQLLEARKVMHLPDAVPAAKVEPQHGIDTLDELSKVEHDEMKMRKYLSLDRVVYVELEYEFLLDRGLTPDPGYALNEEQLKKTQEAYLLYKSEDERLETIRWVRSSHNTSKTWEDGYLLTYRCPLTQKHWFNYHAFSDDEVSPPHPSDMSDILKRIRDNSDRQHDRSVETQQKQAGSIYGGGMTTF